MDKNTQEELLPKTKSEKDLREEDKSKVHTLLKEMRKENRLRLLSRSGITLIAIGALSGLFILPHPVETPIENVAIVNNKEVSSIR